jgi:hypothetical protein
MNEADDNIDTIVPVIVSKINKLDSKIIINPDSPSN